MNRFAKIYGSIWTDDKFSKLSCSAKLLYIYLASSKDCNSIGFFKITLGSIQDEFGMSPDDDEIYTRSQIKELMTELESVGLVRYQEKWLLFNRWLKWNPPQGAVLTKKLATCIEEVLKSNPPLELVAYFLSTLKPALCDINGVNKDGSKFNYYELLKGHLPQSTIISFFGAAEDAKACLEGNPENAIEAALKRRSSGAEPAKTHKNKNENKNNNENKNETVSLNSYSNDSSNINSLPSISVFCADGQPGFIDPAVIGHAAEKYPDIEWDSFKAFFQTYSYNNPAPDKEHLNDYFMAFVNQAFGSKAGGVMHV